MEQSLDLAIPSLESISPPETSSQCDRNYVEGDPAAASTTYTLEPVVPTPELSKNEIQQVDGSIGAVVNVVTGCCCGPSPAKIAESPRERPPLSHGICGCSTSEAQNCSENIVKMTDCYMVEMKATSGSQAMRKGFCPENSEQSPIEFEPLRDAKPPAGSDVESVTHIPKTPIVHANLDFCGCGGNRWYCKCFNDPYTGYFCNCCPCAFKYVLFLLFNAVSDLLSPQPTPGSVASEEMKLCCSISDLHLQD